ncbi:tripartite tricarboxylate transporter substrate binding protein [Pseudorhodoferax sp. Leaf274]|uniref:Bug family tripartite tricarboxylate transporter substrate binding protein n=1 Tax=Pseudorhodoferax sp. Leaf274 TaxID=1736318 RepID=UPI00070320BF|nr:tripartite tricarboxylate transporter substrate binding protein [Pseudorhodoferax sp. Leaf274]KQP41582.1 ABC transporter substrate-binding protein [Pseudorhodoferax sp. Leaf274]
MPLDSLDRRHALALLGLLATGVPAWAQGFPDKPLRILVGASPGGGTDILARVLADKLAPTLKQPVVVENRPGASNTIAAELAARAAPDGSTLLLATNTAQAVAPHMLKLKYDPLKDLQPIGLVAVMPNVLVVSSTGPFKSVKDVQAALAARPGALKYASSGIGSTQHIGGEAFGMVTGTRAIHVPYKGSSQAHIDVIAGEVDMMFDSTSSAMSQIRAGKLRPLAVSSPARSAEMPDVPTLAELGIQGADVSTWYGLYTTGGTPRAAVERLTAELGHALQLPDVQARIKALGGEVGTLVGERFAEMNRSEYEHYGRLVRGANIKAE